MKTYDAKKIADAINRNGIKETDEYEQMRQNIFDWTSACDVEEATGWLMFYMKEAITKGTGKYNSELRCQFLAAYDFYTSLVGHEDNINLTVFKF